MTRAEEAALKAYPYNGGLSFGVEPLAPGTRKDGTFHTRDGGKDRWRPGKTGTLAGWYNGIIAGVVI